MTRRDVATVVALAIGFCAAVVAVWIAHPPVDFEFLPAALCVLTFVLATRVQPWLVTSSATRAPSTTPSRPSRSRSTAASAPAAHVPGPVAWSTRA